MNMIQVKLIMANVAVVCAYILHPDGFYYHFFAHWTILMFAFLAIISLGFMAIEGLFNGIAQFIIFLILGVCCSGFIIPKEGTAEYYANNRDLARGNIEENIYGKCPSATWYISIYYGESGSHDKIFTTKFHGSSDELNAWIPKRISILTEKEPGITIGRIEKDLLYIPKEWLKSNNLPLELSKYEPSPEY